VAAVGFPVKLIRDRCQIVPGGFFPRRLHTPAARENENAGDTWQ